jgi:pyroglutamyl-peptidase
MSNKVLLTSFQTWLPHQKFNSSDRLLEIVQTQANSNLCFARKLPVNIDLATDKVIEAIERFDPNSIICCGMAESRSQLTVESNAYCNGDCTFTKVELEKLLAYLNHTQISHNAGKFVCEGLYYQILNYIETKKLIIPCLFVHIPLLKAENLNIIQQDFMAIINFMQAVKT